METVFISSNYITLGQLMKFVNIISNGSEAKIAVMELKISINGALENRRGRKIYPGDIVKIEKNTYLVQLKNEIN